MKTLTYLFVASGILLSPIVVAQEESGLDDPMDAMHAEQYDPANDPYEQRRAARANNHYEVYNPGGEWAHREESSYEGYEAGDEAPSRYEEHYNDDNDSSYAQDYEESDGAYVEVDEGDSSADGDMDAYPIRNDPAEYEANYLSESYREQGGEMSGDEDYASYDESDQYHEENEESLTEGDEYPPSESDGASLGAGENIRLSSYAEHSDVDQMHTDDQQEQALLDELAAIEQRGTTTSSAANKNVIVSKLDDNGPSDPVEPSLPTPYVPAQNGKALDSAPKSE